MHHRTLH